MKSIDKRALHKREYDSWVNERQIQKTEGEVDTSKALDASMVNTKNSRIASGEQDTNSRPGNDAHTDDADIRPIYDEEPMAKVQFIVDHNVFAIGQQHTEQPEFNNKGELNSRNRGKPVLQPHRNQSVVRQPTTFKSERPRISKPQFASKVDVNNDLSKPITTHYLPKGKEPACAKPHHMIALGSSRRQPTGKIFKTVGLRWVPTGKIFTSSTTKVDSEPTNGSNDDITNQYECEQTLDVSACTLNLSACTSFNPKKEGLRVCSKLRIHDQSNEPLSLKLVPKVVPLADKTTTSQQELELLFSRMYKEYFNAGNR
ncbi:hypothetical protein Tco_1452277, partial [Tanacetum coccineum]